jgi:hypothetical protein
MATIPHIEKHFTATETIRDVVIGMADGLTVPFALAALARPSSRCDQCPLRVLVA